MDYLSGHIDTLVAIGKGALAGVAIALMFSLIAPADTRTYEIMRKAPEVWVWGGIVGGFIGLAKDRMQRDNSNKS